MPAVLDRAARAFLARHRVARLATADAAGTPHVVPFCYALVGDRIYFVVDEKPKRAGRTLKRLRNIAANPAVAVVADDYDEDWSALAFLLVRGRATVVAGEPERTRALAALRARYPQYRTMALDGPTHPVVRIAPLHAHLWRASGNVGLTRRDDGGPRARRGEAPGRRTSRRRRSPPSPR